MTPSTHPTPTSVPARQRFRGRSQQSGITLVEILISLVLGLLLVGAATGIYLSNRQTFRQVENLARLQENARIAFELLGRDIREAGGVPCGAALPIANVVDVDLTDSGNWWAAWGLGIRGYDGDQALPARAVGVGAGDRVNGTDAVVLWSGSADTNVSVTAHNPVAASFQVNTTAHGLEDGDIAMVCDLQQAAIFQVTNANSASAAIVHNTGASQAPGNCRKELGLSAAPPHNCTTAGAAYTFAGGGVISKLRSYAWYVGHNGRGGRSLYRVFLGTSGGNANTTSEEMIENVTGLELQYLERDAAGVLGTAYVDATAVVDWTRVVAVRLNPVYVTAEAVGTDNNVIDQSLPFVVTIRNRSL